MGGTVVIGVGSPLMGDDGLGLVALEVLRERWTLDPAVELIDGGTWGMNLLPAIEDADRLLILDAINRDEAPGTLITLEREQLPRYFELKISPHQVDLKDVLGLAELRGTLPAETVALGVQPERVELGIGLSDTVASRVDVLVAWRWTASRPGGTGPSGGCRPPMHEMSLALEVCRITEEHVGSERLGEIVEVAVEIGDDAGVEVGNFEFCLEALLANPPFGRGRPRIVRCAGDVLRVHHLEIDDGGPDD